MQTTAQLKQTRVALMLLTAAVTACPATAQIDPLLEDFEKNDSGFASLNTNQREALEHKFQDLAFHNPFDFDHPLPATEAHRAYAPCTSQ